MRGRLAATCASLSAGRGNGARPAFLTLPEPSVQTRCPPRRGIVKPSETTAGGRLQAAQLDADRFGEILSPDARAFLTELHGRFEPTRRALLDARAERQ